MDSTVLPTSVKKCCAGAITIMMLSGCIEVAATVQSSNTLFSGYRENLSTIHSPQHLPQSSTSKQVIVPEIRFDCVGSVTSWSGHTLVLTRENFLEILTHTITFQVWRPSLDNKSYTLVGSNHLTFQGQRLSDGIKPIENQSYIAYFSFTEPVPGGEQVSFIPGDVVGWYYPPANGTNDKPLSILYTNLSQQDNVSTLLIFSGIGGPHVLCNVHESSNSVITSVLPLISAAYDTVDVPGSCDTTSMRPVTATPPAISTVTITTTTTTTTTSSLRTNQSENSFFYRNEERITSWLTVAMTIVILLIQVFVCGYIIISFKRINRLPSGKGYKPSESFDGTVDHTLSQEHERCFESAHVSNNHEAPLPGGQVHDPSTRHDLIEQRRHTTAHESFEMRSQQEHALQPWSHVCEPNWSGDKEPHKTYIRKSWSHDRHGFTPQQSNRPPQLCLESEIL